VLTEEGFQRSTANTVNYQQYEPKGHWVTEMKDNYRAPGQQ
jgi:hypothetical protein